MVALLTLCVFALDDFATPHLTMLYPDYEPYDGWAETLTGKIKV